MLRLALAGLSRILAKADGDPFAVLGGGIDQQSLDIAWVGPRAYHIEQPVIAVPITTELDADGPIGVVVLGLRGRREIPIADDIELRRSGIGDGRLARRDWLWSATSASVGARRNRRRAATYRHQPSRREFSCKR